MSLLSTSLDSIAKFSAEDATDRNHDSNNNNNVNALTVFEQQPTADTRDGGIILDALPYVDQVHEDYEQYATSLIEQEMKNTASSSSSSSSKNKRKLPPLAPLHFRTPFMKEQYERLERGQGLPTATTTPVIDLSPPSEEQDQDNVQAWQEAVKRVKIGYERERIRAMLLELEMGAAAPDGIAAQEWKMHNALLEQTELHYQGLSQTQQEVVEEINLQRQAEQQKQGQELSRVTAQYQEVQVKLEQLRKAVRAMEQEVQQLQQQQDEQHGGGGDSAKIDEPK